MQKYRTKHSSTTLNKLAGIGSENEIRNMKVTKLDVYRTGVVRNIQKE